MINNLEKKWVTKRFKKWTFEYEVYDEDTEYSGLEIRKGRIPYGGLKIRNVYHDNYRMAFSISVNAIWLTPGPKVYFDLEPSSKKLVLGPSDFIQLPYVEEGTDYDPVRFDKGYTDNKSKKNIKDKGTVAGLPYNFATYNWQVEGEMIVKWKSREPIFGDDSGHLFITQKFVFTDYSQYPSHEPSGALMAARIHPITIVDYVDKNDGYFNSVRIDYRLHLNVDQSPQLFVTDDYYISRKKLETHRRNHFGVFKDEDTVYFNTQMAENDVAYAVFSSAEKPIQADLVADGLVNGTIKAQYNKSTWDNIHIWGAGGNRHISAPGGFHAIHMHWRWSKFLQESRYLVPFAGKPQFKGEGIGGALTHPLIANQNIKFAIVAKHMLPEFDGETEQSGEDFESYFTKIALNPYKYSADPNSGGENSIVFYSCEILKDQPSPKAQKSIAGNVFLHGIFFAHEDEMLGKNGVFSGIGSHEVLYLNPANVDVKKWKRNPEREQ